MMVDAHAITDVEARQNPEGLRCCKDPETRVDHISEEPEILIVRTVGYLLDQDFEVAIAREGRLVDVGWCHERKRRAVALFRSALPSHGRESSFKSQQHLLRQVCIIFLRRARMASCIGYMGYPLAQLLIVAFTPFMLIPEKPSLNTGKISSIHNHEEVVVRL
jgi:hypothetical protein